MDGNTDLVGTDEITKELLELLDPGFEAWLSKPWITAEVGRRLHLVGRPKLAGWKFKVIADAQAGRPISYLKVMNLTLELERLYADSYCPPPKSAGRSKAAQKKGPKRRKAKRSGTVTKTAKSRPGDPVKAFVKTGPANPQGVGGQPAQRGKPVKGAGKKPNRK